MPETKTMIDLIDMGKRAREASYVLATLYTDTKNAVLHTIADQLEAHTPHILEANAQDLELAHKNAVDPVWIRDRLDLTARMTGIIADVRHVATLPDPVGERFEERTLDSGITAYKRRVPVGVLGVIYESRPNVTVDIATLALKTGNAVIMRGGSDTLYSNMALAEVLQMALAEHGLPSDAVQVIASTDRVYVGQMLKMHVYIDMLIPRGGSKLHDFCREHSTIPVIIGGMGICHLYVDESANLEASLPVIENAKTQRPAVCNALDTLLVHEAVAKDFLPKVVKQLGKAGVVFKADPRALAYLDDERVLPAEPEDFDTEWMGLTLGLKVVSGLDEAVAHIRQHSTQHSDGILTQTTAHAEAFLNTIDSACVYWNASTRFTDGSALGLGAEVAVSTQKLHARGPMALAELTTYKWIIQGDYTSRL